MDIVRLETYSYPDYAASLFMYLGLQGIFSAWKFTNSGMEALSGWMDTVGTAELDDARKLVVKQQFQTTMQALVASGDAWPRREDPYVHVNWWIDQGTPP